MEVYLGNPGDKLTAWCKAHYTPTPKTPVWGEGKWIITNEEGKTCELTYNSSEDKYIGNGDGFDPFYGEVSLSKTGYIEGGAWQKTNGQDGVDINSLDT